MSYDCEQYRKKILVPLIIIPNYINNNNDNNKKLPRTDLPGTSRALPCIPSIPLFWLSPPPTLHQIIDSSRIETRIYSLQNKS